MAVPEICLQYCPVNRQGVAYFRVGPGTCINNKSCGLRWVIIGLQTLFGFDPRRGKMAVFVHAKSYFMFVSVVSQTNNKGKQKMKG